MPVAALRKADGGPLDNNPIDSFSMDRHRNDKSGATTYWVRGGELLNVWIARYEPDSAAFEQKEGDWFPVGREEILREVGEAFEGSASREDLLALAGAIVGPTKWGLYDRDALETWVQGTKTPRNNAFPKRSAKVCDHCCVPPDRAGRPRFRGLLGQEDARHQMVPKNPHRFSPKDQTHCLPMETAGNDVASEPCRSNWFSARLS